KAGRAADQPAVLRAQRLALGRVAWMTLALLVPVLVAWRIYPGDRFDNSFPKDYTLAFGPDRPFAPSLARTVSGSAYDARSLSGSQSCGDAGCHQQIAAEWSVSAHRWAAMDAGFQRIQQEMAKQNGPESTRY